MSAQDETKKTSWAPSSKLQAAGAWGATAVVAGYLLREYAHIEVPEAVWLSAGVVVTWLGGYLKREKRAV
jgi:uncharacterized membrane protein YjjB (DUF3815 family)